METEKRMVRFDNDLKIEAYHFEGLMQKFPNHFHEHYVLGFVESGRRFLTCKNKQYNINKGDLLLFNPLDNHACEQIDDKALDWRCFNIKRDVMCSMAQDITGKMYLPQFTATVVSQSDAVPQLKDLHEMIMSETKDLNKEETFYLLIEQLISNYTGNVMEQLRQISNVLQAACDYMETNYTQAITLNDLSRVSGVNKYTLLRNFTKQRGITPYQYLSTIRINKAKRFLETGISPMEAAFQAGFTDQSHFTRFFKNFIGLTPKQYQDIFAKTDEKPSGAEGLNEGKQRH